MVSHPLFDQLLLVALVFIYLLLRVRWNDHPPRMPHPLPAPAPPRRRRAKAPKPFAGLIHKPLCEACAQGTDERPKAPGSPPSMITFSRGRRRTVDTHMHFCRLPCKFDFSCVVVLPTSMRVVSQILLRWS